MAGLPQRLSAPQHRWQLDPVMYTVVVAGKPSVALTPLEFRILHYLITHPGPIPYHVLLRNVWPRTIGDGENMIAVYIRRLRRKLEPDPAHPRHILTVHGHGYAFHP